MMVPGRASAMCWGFAPKSLANLNAISSPPFVAPVKLPEAPASSPPPVPLFGQTTAADELDYLAEANFWHWAEKIFRNSTGSHAPRPGTTTTTSPPWPELLAELRSLIVLAHDCELFPERRAEHAVRNLVAWSRQYPALAGLVEAFDAEAAR